MSETKTSQTQQEAAANLFDKMADENIARMESFYAEMTKMHDKSVQQTTTAIDEAAKLMKEQVAYSAKLATEWQRIALESSRQAASFMTKPWTQA